MPQPWRRSEIIEINDSSESGDSGGESIFSRNSRLVSERTNTPPLFREHVAPVSITITQLTTHSQSVDRPTGSNSRPYGLSPVTASSRTPGKGEGKAKEVTSITTPQACEGSSSQRNATCLPPASGRRPDDLFGFGALISEWQPQPQQAGSPLSQLALPTVHSMRTGTITEILDKESDHLADEHSPERHPSHAQALGSLQKEPSLVMPFGKYPQLTPPLDAQFLLTRVPDIDPLGAREHTLDTNFAEMEQLVEGSFAFVEDLLLPAVDPEPDPEPEPIDTLTFALAKVLEIVPDVQPDHITALIHSYLDGDGEPMSLNLLVEQILHQLLENPDYPKVEKKGKKRRGVEEPDATGNGEDRVERPKKKVKIDYRTTQRSKVPSVAYRNLALYHLGVAFPLVRKTYIRSILARHHGFYAPAYIHLKEHGVTHTQIKTTATKGSARALIGLGVCEDFEREQLWVEEWAQGREFEVETEIDEDEAAAAANSDNAEGAGAKGKGRAKEGDLPESVECEEGEGIECGCCFSTYVIDTMVQCDEGHLFCRSCTRNYASERLGMRISAIKCMDQEGCSSLFSLASLKICLPEKLMMLYERVKMEEEVTAAGLEGLEECPFCDYKCVIENDMERLFTCLNDDGGCGVVSCRECKKPDHLPKTCSEAAEDNVLDVQHTVEEAMTKALIRNCPKCQRQFLKENGCNKMTCTNCGTLSCYICRKKINGYDHFNQQPGQPSQKPGDKCPLWDGPGGAGPETRHVEEVKQARDQALAELKMKNLEGVDIDKIKVDVPVAGPSRPVVPAPVPRPWLEVPVYPQRPLINRPAPRVVPVPPQPPALRVVPVPFQPPALRVVPAAAQPAPVPVLPHYRDAFGAMDPYFDAYNLLPLPANFNAYQPLLPPQAPLQLPPAMATVPPPIMQPVVAPQPVHARAKRQRRRDYAEFGNRANPYM